MCKKLIKNSQPFGKNVRKPQGDFLTYTVHSTGAHVARTNMTVIDVWSTHPVRTDYHLASLSTDDWDSNELTQHCVLVEEQQWDQVSRSKTTILIIKHRDQNLCLKTTRSRHWSRGQQDRCNKLSDRPATGLFAVSLADRRRSSMQKPPSMTPITPDWLKLCVYNSHNVTVVMWTLRLTNTQQLICKQVTSIRL